MNHATHNKIVSFIWSIADDCLRDVFVRGKYRDVILPMFVLRRIDCLLEETKDAVLAEVAFQKDEANMAVLDPDGLREASGQVFYNTSKFTLKRLLGNPSQLEAIIQLPNNIFYNTGITTYIWILTNHKPKARQGKVQLIDASQLYEKLRKNLGEKNCAFTSAHIKQITRAYLDMADTGKEAVDGLKAQVFNNPDFGYWKITVERPLRKSAQFTAERVESLRFDKRLAEEMQWMYGQWGDDLYEPAVLKDKKSALEDWLEKEDIDRKAGDKKKLLDTKFWVARRDLRETAARIHEKIGEDLSHDFNVFQKEVKAAVKALKIKLSAPQLKAVLEAVSWRDPDAEPVLAGGKADGYEPDSELRDTESVPLTYEGGIQAYFDNEVRPHVADAWIAEEKTVIGYQISFNKYFYVHQPLRDLAEVVQEIRDLEKETEGLLEKILDFGG